MCETTEAYGIDKMKEKCVCVLSLDLLANQNKYLESLLLGRLLSVMTHVCSVLYVNVAPVVLNVKHFRWLVCHTLLLGILLEKPRIKNEKKKEEASNKGKKIRRKN